VFFVGLQPYALKKVRIAFMGSVATAKVRSQPPACRNRFMLHRSGECQQNLFA
jgi:hypothetical protein